MTVVLWWCSYGVVLMLVTAGVRGDTGSVGSNDVDGSVGSSNSASAGTGVGSNDNGGDGRGSDGGDSSGSNGLVVVPMVKVPPRGR